MADERDRVEQSKDAAAEPTTPQQGDQSAIEDLDANPGDVDQVKGGRLRFSSDPCEGGEIRRY